MPAIAQPFVRKITKGDAIALGHFCTIGYMVEAGAAWIFGERGERKHSIEDIKLPKYMEFFARHVSLCCCCDGAIVYDHRGFCRS